MNKYIVKPLGQLLMSEVASDDIKVAMVPVSKKSVGLYSTVNMLFITPATKRFLMKMKALWLVERVSKDSDWKHLVADLIKSSTAGRSIPL